MKALNIKMMKTALFIRKPLYVAAISLSVCTFSGLAGLGGLQAAVAQDYSNLPEPSILSKSPIFGLIKTANAAQDSSADFATTAQTNNDLPDRFQIGIPSPETVPAPIAPQAPQDITLEKPEMVEQASDADAMDADAMEVDAADVPDTADANEKTASKEEGEQPTDADGDDITYFDSSPGITKLIGDRDYLEKVDPASLGGQKFVVVEKNAEAGSQQSLLVAARRARDLGRYEVALDFYDRMLKTNGEDTLLRLERAITLQNLGRYDSAISAYNKVLDVDPENVLARVNMLGLMKEQYPAVAVQKMLEIYRENPELKGLAAQLGLTYAQTGEFDKARRYLQSAIALEPENARHVFNLAIVEDRLGRGGEALSLYEKALQVDAASLSGQKLPREKIYDRLSVLRERG